MDEQKIALPPVRFRAQLARRRLHGMFSWLLSDLGVHASLELYWRSLSYDVARRNAFSFPDVLATGAAANWSLLYAVARCVLETEVASVCEVGVGETTVLLDALQTQRSFRHEILETDALWAAKLSERVGFEIETAQLEVREIHGQIVEGYVSVPQGPFDLIIVDGPSGSRRRSRWSALDLVDGLGADYIVIIDDVERRGEQDLLKAILQRRPASGVRFFSGSKSQCLLFSGRGSVVEYW